MESVADSNGLLVDAADDGGLSRKPSFVGKLSAKLASVRHSVVSSVFLSASPKKVSLQSNATPNDDPLDAHGKDCSCEAARHTVNI